MDCCYEGIQAGMKDDTCPSFFLLLRVKMVVYEEVVLEDLGSLSLIVLDLKIGILSCDLSLGMLRPMLRAVDLMKT